MEKLQELIAFLKSKGLEHKKIDVDVLCALIEYFGKEAEAEQLCIGGVVGRSEQLKCDHQPKRYDKKHTSCKKCGKVLQMKP